MKSQLIVSFFALNATSALALSGKVSDQSGQPISGALIEIVGKPITVKSNESGEFSFDETNVDEIHIEAPGYQHKVIHLHDEVPEFLEISLAKTAIETIDVVGLPLHASTMESAQPISVISGEELRNRQAATLGETLKNEVGIHSSYFGPVSSSPIIRGLDGPRVLIAQNGLDVSDASRVGPDHVVSTETSTAQQVEILRGPATLFFGSGAIGGVVNIVDERVPRKQTQSSRFNLQYNSVAAESLVNFSHNGGAEEYAYHIDGAWQDGDDYDIPGAAELDADPLEPQGILENSAVRSYSGNIGASWLLEQGFIGLSYGRLDRLNGIPGHGHGEEEAGGGAPPVEEAEEEMVKSDLEQDRWQLISEFHFDNSFISDINSRLGYTAYQHQEILDDPNEEGTLFENTTLQLRSDFLHQEVAGWRGAFSFEYKKVDFSAAGEEAFTPPSIRKDLALAVMEEKHYGDFLFQAGARIEKVWLSSSPVNIETDTQNTTFNFVESRFTPMSLSLGSVWHLNEDYQIALALTRSERAPSAQEVYAAGPHIGTRTYELGSIFRISEVANEYLVSIEPSIREEVAKNIDLSLRKQSGDVGFVLNFFYNEMDNYFYQRFTGLFTEDLFHNDAAPDADTHDHGENLPIYLFVQDDVELYGSEFELAWQINEAFSWRLWGDTIRATLQRGGYLPRIPPKRLGSALKYTAMTWTLNVEASHYFDQNSNSGDETPTDGYTLLSAQLNYNLSTNLDDLSIFVKLDNIGDEDARVHSSFLKDEAPLPGRNISIGLRGEF